jgi:hypothetical protein
MIVDKRLPRRADRVQGVALGPGAPRRPLGPTDLDHPLAVGLQEAGQPGAVAAGPFHRPTAPTRHPRLAERKQATVAGQVGRRRSLRQRAADAIGGCGGQGVPVGVHPDHPIDGVGQPGHHGSPFQQTPGRVGPEDTARRFCDGSQPEGWTGCSSSQQAACQADAGTDGRQLVTKATLMGA